MTDITKITASCGHRVESLDYLRSVEFEEERFGPDGIETVTIYAQYCSACADKLHADE